MNRNELPPICTTVREKHKWVSPEVHGCGWGPGDQAMDEAMVVVSGVGVPGPGDVCCVCFQVFDEPEGKRDVTLEAVYCALLAWKQ